MLNKIKTFFVNIFNKIIGIKRYDFKSFSFMLFAIVYVLGFTGIYLISILQDADERMYQKQIAAYAVGLVVILLVSIIDYHFIGKYFIVLYLISLGLLLICRFSNTYPIYGWAHYDARRWIKIGGDPSLGKDNPGFEFMPSEITKVAMIIFTAKFFDLCYKKIKKIWVMLLSIVFMAIPTFLILTQTDLSTSVVLVATFAVMLFASEIPLKFILPFVIVGVPLAGGLFWYVQQPDQVLLKWYQQQRILAAIHPEQFPELRFQQDNALAAIRSGGMIGKLLSGDTGVRGTTHVPVKESDFIFTAVGEEFGFIGSIAVIVLYFILILLIIRIARRAKDYLGMMIATGMGALISFQVFINIGVVTSLLPNTGIALPFMSSGLSALLMNLVMVGIILNISLQPKKNEVPVEKDEFELL
ncbi:MAG: FtsW/RodA/SpoVE family cell cycle protein [Lachnospiraceae bacterium]|nr:FtsW/RodA/SpoVE family cell cycle protein [Lachnospiraceae bacterium]